MPVLTNPRKGFRVSFDEREIPLMDHISLFEFEFIPNLGAVNDIILPHDIEEELARDFLATYNSVLADSEELAKNQLDERLIIKLLNLALILDNRRYFLSLALGAFKSFSPLNWVSSENRLLSYNQQFEIFVFWNNKTNNRTDDQENIPTSLGFNQTFVDEWLKIYLVCQSSEFKNLSANEKVETLLLYEDKKKTLEEVMERFLVNNIYNEIPVWAQTNVAFNAFYRRKFFPVSKIMSWSEVFNIFGDEDESIEQEDEDEGDNEDEMAFFVFDFLLRFTSTNLSRLANSFILYEEEDEGDMNSEVKVKYDGHLIIELETVINGLHFLWKAQDTQLKTDYILEMKRGENYFYFHQKNNLPFSVVYHCDRDYRNRTNENLEFFWYEFVLVDSLLVQYRGFNEENIKWNSKKSFSLPSDEKIINRQPYHYYVMNSKQINIENEHISIQTHPFDPQTNTVKEPDIICSTSKRVIRYVNHVVYWHEKFDRENGINLTNFTKKTGLGSLQDLNQEKYEELNLDEVYPNLRITDDGELVFGSDEKKWGLTPDRKLVSHSSPGKYTTFNHKERPVVIHDEILDEKYEYDQGHENVKNIIVMLNHEVQQVEEVEDYLRFSCMVGKRKITLTWWKESLQRRSREEEWVEESYLWSVHFHIDGSIRELEAQDQGRVVFRETYNQKRQLINHFNPFPYLVPDKDHGSKYLESVVDRGIQDINYDEEQKLRAFDRPLSPKEEVDYLWNFRLENLAI